MNLAHSHLYDLIIVGAGPSGLSCAIEARKAGLKFLVLDKGNVVNSIQHFQRNMFFFSTPELLEIGNIPFVIPATRPTSLDCVNYYRKVAEVHGIECRLYEEATSMIKKNGEFTLETSRGCSYKSRAVVVATGYYDTPNVLNVPGEELPFVTHYYRDPLQWYKQKVLIVGGKNSAVEAALDLYRHGAQVTVVHRSAALSTGVKYWILPDFENRVSEGSIKLILNAVVEEFQPGAVRLKGGDGKEWAEQVDAVFVLIGYRPNIAFLRRLGIEIDSESLAPVHNSETYETNVVRLFVAGGMVGGKFNNKVFIENGREHGKKIIAALQNS